MMYLVCSIVWYGMVSYGMARTVVVWCGIVQESMMGYHDVVAWYVMVSYRIISYMVRYEILHHSGWPKKVPLFDS